MDKSITQSARITVVDALRGFALVTILVLHNIEIFEIHGFQQSLPAWMIAIDKVIWDTFFFIFGGKSYAIFALLFGLTFYIQSHNQEKRGKDFRLRFMWRMVLLIGFGFINTLFYQGEILVMYAIIGFFIIPFNKLSDKSIFIWALIFLLQPIMLIKIIYSSINPDAFSLVPAYMPYYMKVGSVLTEGTMLEAMKSNVTNGRIASLLWLWINGRFEQTLGLFLLGFLAGRRKIFFNREENIKFWKKVLLFGMIFFFPFYILKYGASSTGGENFIVNMSASIYGLWANLAMMSVMVSGFILLFYNKRFQPALDRFSPIGKMSLTNYILQSIVGATLYYGYGFGLYRFIGPSVALFIGILLSVVMWAFSNYWMNRHRRGICESLWHRLTWVGSGKK